MIRPQSVIALAAAFVAGVAPTAIAANGNGGASPDAPPAAKAPVAAKPVKTAGPAVPVVRPTIDAITCRTSCKGIATAVKGSVVQVSGDAMDQVASVIFLGRKGARDDVAVPARALSATAAATVVPDAARSGPVRVVTSAGARSLQSSRTIAIRSAAARMKGGQALEVRSDTRRVMADGAHPASVSFFVRSATPMSVSVDIVRAADGAVVAHWDMPSLAPGSVSSVAWDGKVAGALAPEGRYVWRVAQATGAATRSAVSGGAGASAAAAPSGPSFLFVSHRFPIAGPHTYNMGAGRFGAVREGHTHQGQDVFAACGTPLVAVTNGTIKFAGEQANAGNYLVIAGADGNDYAYMHLKDKVTFKKGDRLTIGQPVGRVGDTGDAVGCHLHFEIWPAPGWYTGGSPIDPLPALREWDGLAADPPAATGAKKK